MRLECRDLSFRYSDKQPFILEHYSMSVSEGERVGLMAPSGSGKSTLAKLLAGILRPASGEVLLDGRPIQSGGVRPVQLIFQRPELAISPRWRMRRVLEEAGEPEPERCPGPERKSERRGERPGNGKTVRPSGEAGEGTERQDFPGGRENPFRPGEKRSDHGLSEG